MHGVGKLKKCTNYGFTIVELLIVIVVIAILAAITIVAFNGIQARAQFTAIQSAHTQSYRQALAGNGSLDVDAQLNECSGTVAAVGGGRQATVDPAVWSPTKDPSGGCGFYFPSNVNYGDVPLDARMVKVMDNIPKNIQTMKVGFLIKHADDTNSSLDRYNCATNHGGSIFTIATDQTPYTFVNFSISNSCTVRVSTQQNPASWDSGGSSWVDSSKLKSKTWTAVVVEVSNQRHVKIYVNGKLDTEDDLPWPLAVPTDGVANGYYGSYSDHFRGQTSKLFVSINSEL